MHQRSTNSQELRVFLCYRRADGAWHAETIYRALSDVVLDAAQGGSRRLRVYYDKTAPGVADWTTLHFPSLQASHALVLVCTPGVATDLSDRSHPDWVYRELRWWLKNRTAAPIVVDATGEGHRWLPEFIKRKWPNLNRIELVRSDDWSERDLSAVTDRLRDRVIGAIRESEQATVFDELEKQRRLTRRLGVALACAIALLVGLGLSIAIAISAREDARGQALANASYIFSDRDPTVALRFALLAKNSERSATAALAVLRAFNSASWFYSHRFDEAWDGDIDESGAHVAWIESGSTLHLIDLHKRESKEWTISSENVKFLSNSKLALWSGWNGKGTLGHIEIRKPSGELVVRHELQFLRPVFARNGTIVVPSFSDNEVVARIIDPTTGALTSLSLGASVQDLGGEAVALPDGTGIVLATTIPGRLVVARANGRTDVREIPFEYHASDVDVDLTGTRAVVYLSGAFRGVSDALGWVDLSTQRTDPLTIVPLPISPGFDSGGLVRFLASGRVLAASTDGWTRILDLKSATTTELPTRSRAADEIVTSRDGAYIFVGRRSGVVSIYNPDGVLVGRLLGESHSDGLNPVFRRIAVSNAGTEVLTVARTGVRLWHKPSYDLVIPHEASFRVFDKLPDKPIAHFQQFPPLQVADQASACEGTGTVQVDDDGQIGLCIQLAQSNRMDVLPTGLEKGAIDLIGSGKLDKIGHRLIGEQADRVFVLSPEIIKEVIENESRLGRLWCLDAKTEQMWAVGAR